MDGATLAIVISVVACLSNVLGVVLNRDRRNTEDAIWRGEVNGKLDVACGIRGDVEKLKEESRRTQQELAVVDASAKSAHHRLDELTEELHTRPCRAQA